MADTATKKAVARRPAWLPEPVQQSLRSAMPHIATLLPKDIPLDHFRAALALYLPQVGNLSSAQPESVLEAIVKMAMDGMLPGRDSVIVVFKGRASKIDMYGGLCRQLDRTGRVAKPVAQVVYSNDTFSIDLANDTCTHQPAIGTARGNPIGAYARIFLKDGTVFQHWMDLDDLTRVRNTSLGREQEAWVKHTTEMYRKTVLKNNCKYIHLTEQFAAYLQAEDEEVPAPEEVIERGVVAGETLFPASSYQSPAEQKPLGSFMAPDEPDDVPEPGSEG